MTWRIMIDLSYEDRATCIAEFERVFQQMKHGGWRKCAGGNGQNQYMVKGPSEPPLNDYEIQRLREILSEQSA